MGYVALIVCWVWLVLPCLGFPDFGVFLNFGFGVLVLGFGLGFV